MPLISIIVPVYNAARFVQQTLDSLREQTISDFEVLMLDDQSEDQSLAICEAMSARDSRFRTIPLSHGGVSKARNVGIDAAKGRFITFVDADDWAEPDYLAAFFRTPLPDPDQNDRVMVIQDILLDYSQAPEPQPANSRIFNYTSATLQRAESKNIQLAAQQQFLTDGYTSSKLYATSLLHRYNLRFPVDITFSEDHLFFFAVLRHIDTVIWQSDAKLHYMQRGSLNQNLGSNTYSALFYIRFSQLFLEDFKLLIERFSIDQGPYTINLYRISVLRYCMIACQYMTGRNYVKVLRAVATHGDTLRQINYNVTPRIVKPWLLKALCYLPESLYFVVFVMVRMRILRKKLIKKIRCNDKK